MGRLVKNAAVVVSAVAWLVTASILQFRAMCAFDALKDAHVASVPELDSPDSLQKQLYANPFRALRRAAGLTTRFDAMVDRPFPDPLTEQLRQRVRRATLLAKATFLSLPIWVVMAS